MTTQQPEALRLADIVERLNVGVHSQAIAEEYTAAARELRRLHAENEELKQQIAATQPADQAAYPHLPNSVADVVDFMDGRGVNVDFSHPAPAGGTSLYTAAQMRAYVDADRAQRAATSPEIVKLERGFRWVSEKQHHVPTLLIEFTPVPANSPNTEKGWADRDALAAALATQAK